MTVQKIIEYNSLDSNGQISSDKYNFKLNILEDSGNYLIHRDILRHQLSQKQGTVSTKTRSEVRGEAKNLGNKKERVGREQDQAVLHYGEVVVLPLVPNQKQRV
jgi:hypothetical protein